MGAVLIGRYKVIEELGRGGMGVVYRGEDPILERQVAIKVLPPKKLTQKTIDRFLREAKTAARLDSPYIVKIHDIGQIDDIHYIVMEYVEGHTLSDMMEYDEVPSALALRERLAVFHQVLQAVRYAHEHGVVHRDLKPDNIMVTKSGQVKVMDFGLAFFEGRHSLTEVGQVMGTAAYVSPEQAQGKVTDQKTDIYSLGVILFEMITGRWPFTATNPLEMFKKVAEEPAPSPRQFNKTISADLEHIVLKALAKNPYERYNSVNDLLKEYRRCEKALGVSREEEEDVSPLAGALAAASAEGGHATDASTGSVASSAESEVNAALSALSELSLSIGELSKSLLSGGGATPEPVATPAAPATPAPVATPAAPAPAAMPNIAGAYALPYAPIPEGLSLRPTAPSPGPVIREAIERTSVDASRPAPDYMQLGVPLATYGGATGSPALAKTAVAAPSITPKPAAKTTESQSGSRSFASSSSGGVASSSWMAGVNEKSGSRLENLVDRIQKKEEAAAQATPANERTQLCSKCGMENALGSASCCRCGQNLRPSHYIIEREASSFCAEGVKLYEKAQYNEAIVELLQAVAKDPNSGEAYLCLGRCYLELNELGQAHASLEKAAALLGNDPQPYLALASFYQASEQLEMVISSLHHALDRDSSDTATRLRLAFAYYEMDNVDAALAEYEQVVGDDPQNLEANRQLGIILAACDRVSEAIPFLEQACNLEPADPRTYGLLSRLYIRNGEYGQAQQALRNALQYDESNATLYADLASLYLVQGQDKLAVQELSRALEIDPGNADASVELASLLYQGGQVVEALQRLENSLEYHPRNLVLHRNVGEIYMYAGRLDQALSHFEEVVKLDPDSVELNNRLGRIKLRKHYGQEELVNLQKAVELHPVNSAYREELAMAYYSNQQLPAAVQELVKASRLDYKNPDIHKALGIMLVDLGQNEEAVRQLNSSIELMPHDAQAHGMLGRAYIGQGLNNMAIKEFQRALELDADLYLLNLPLARAFAHQGRNDMALQCFQRFLRRVGDNSQVRLITEAYIGMGDAYLSDKDYTRALDVYRAALHRFPAEPGALHGIAKVYLARRDFAQASRWAQKAMEVEPLNADIKITLAAIESSQEKWAVAANILQGAIKENPNRPGLYELLGRAYRKSGRFQDAIDVFASAIQLFPDSAGQFLWLRGRVEYRQGQYEAAVWSYRQSLDIAQGDWRIFVDLAKACAALQQNDDALQSLQEARRLAPQSEWARIDKMIGLL